MIAKINEFDPKQIFSEEQINFPIRTPMHPDNFELHRENITKMLEYLIGQKHCVYKPNPEQLRIIEILTKWLCGLIGNPQAGILISGSIGVGKTTIMDAFISYYAHLYRKIVKKYHAKELPLKYKQHGIEYFYNRPIFIDDLGKEEPITTDWGQKFDTWGDLFAIRYERKVLTFATSNYKINGAFKEIYGDVIIDRMREHFNIIETEGSSLR